MPKYLALCVVAGLSILPAQAQIQDNSFLLEEAYNQEPGVVQHINTFTRFDDSDDWVYTFTQEWPAPSLRHQLSATFPYRRLTGIGDDESGLGDVALNYRYQLLGSGEDAVAFSPRLSLLLPTGDEDRGLGAGALGYQVNLPLSVVLARNMSVWREPDWGIMNAAGLFAAMIPVALAFLLCGLVVRGRLAVRTPYLRAHRRGME